MRLIQTGERLFAKHGIDAVSMREIASAAKCGDTNAVSYNFGSKDGLIRAIFVHRIGQMEDVRGEMLMRLEKAGRLNDIASLVGVLFLPQLQLVDADGTHPYASFLLNFATRHWSSGSLRWKGATDASPNLVRLIELFAAQLPNLPRPIVDNRIVLCNMTFQSALVRWDHMHERDQVSLEQRVRDVIIQATASLLSIDSGQPVASSVEDWLAQFG